MKGLRWALLAFLYVGAAQADVDPSTYLGEGKAKPAGRTSEQLKREVARDMEQQARQEQSEADEQAQRRARAEAEEARRPYPQRLLQSRCTLCHPADYYLNQHHTTIGWHGVILRMRWFNQAPLAIDEHTVLAGELTRLRPAEGLDALAEHGLSAGAVAVALAGPLWLGRRLWRRGRGRFIQARVARAAGPIRWQPKRPDHDNDTALVALPCASCRCRRSGADADRIAPQRFTAAPGRSGTDGCTTATPAGRGCGGS